MSEPEDAAEWAAWLALPADEQRRRLGFAKDEVDAFGYTDVRLLAAKALHGQPFGFTREDIDFLAEVTQRQERSVRLRLIALRLKIEALLAPAPPEKPNSSAS